MPRLPHHSPNYGGKRPGAGRPKGSKNKFQADNIERVRKYKVHPIDLLMEVVNDEDETRNTRLNAAVHVLPYIAPKQMAIAVKEVSELEQMTEGQKINRIRGLLGQLDQKRPEALAITDQVQAHIVGEDVVEGEIVNGSDAAD